MHRGGVEQIDPPIGERLTDAVEHGSDRYHRGSRGRLPPLDVQQAVVRGPRVRIGGVGQAQVGGLLPRGGISQQRLRFIGVSRHVQAPARQRREAGDVSGGVMGVAAGGPVMACPDGDQDRADTLVTEIELHLLERALHEERRVGVHDRAETLKGMACGNADQELLADAQVAQPSGVAARCAGVLEPIGSDVREQQHDPRVRVEQIRRDVHAAVLRAAGADPVDPQRGQSAAIPSLDASPDLGNPGGPGTRTDARGDRGRARSASGRKDSDPAGLGATVQAVAAPAGRPNRAAREPSREAGELHRVRVSLAEELCPVQHWRSRSGARFRSALLAR